MTAQDWYRRALGTDRQAAPAAPQAYAQPQHQQGYAPQYQAPPQGGIPWQMLQQQQVPNIDTRTIPRGAVTPENFLEMAKFWKGGEAKSAALSCPRCGGTMFRRFEGRREAAPLCEDCNYNGGMFEQGQGAVAVQG